MLKAIFLLLIVSFQIHAKNVHVGTIEHIDEAPSPHELTHLYISNGYVLKLSQAETKSIYDYENARENKLQLKFVVNDDRRVLGVENLGKRESLSISKSLLSFEPTLLSNPEEARRIFSSLRKGSTPWSQCYNRAHIWAYESKKTFDLNSMKVFMFYTRKYIREYNFKWWFHVSPFTYVNENGTKTEKVLDREFTKSPLPMKSWTDIFMQNKVNCPVIRKYSEYENRQDAEYCYLYKVPMYYLQPLDLDNLERTGTTKNQWLNYEVKRAYRNGFGVWP